MVSVCMFGGLRGASIIDSLDTLYIMGLMEEYNDAKEWVQTSLDLNSQWPCVVDRFEAVPLCFSSNIVSSVFSKARDILAGIKSFLCGHRPRRVTL
ncbi:hypothetical protein NQZ68_021050 [Dissostichus eleginoides]|nr:hypothetical protein NQZ68_021050 [Dissostichus eleginoides]